MSGCCRGLPVAACIARYSCSDENQPHSYDLAPKMRMHELETPSDSLYELMAEAMLDPKLRKVLVHEGIVYTSGTTPTGNATRREILLRALEAAKAQGWELRKVK